ncbi:MAG: Do family serine endopeptidase [Spirochaetaceae bacterium]|nr:Do family serine endopeptidase [Spirochaetaceae bacterium]
MAKSKKFSGVILLFIAVSLIIFSQTLFSSPSKETIQGNSENSVRTIPDTREQVFYSFSSVAKEALPIVVQINTVEVVEQIIPAFRSPFDFLFGNEAPQQGGQKREHKRPGLGSGVIVKQDGNKVYILTNNHVAEKAKEIKVKLNDGREFDAKIIGNDSRTDLALIMFETKEKVPVAILGDSDDLEVGDIVLAVGSPYGFESTVTMGIVSALGRHALRGIAGFTDYIQTDASINPGNSGGALVNMKGEVVGINTWIASASGGSVGVGFAIPINNSKKAINDFITTGRITYGWLGVSIGDLSGSTADDLRKSLGLENKKGAMVFSLFKNSPAFKSGLLPGDFIIKIDNENIENADQLTKIVGKLSPGSNPLFRIIRDKKELTLNVKIEKRADESEVQKNKDLWPGIIVTNLTDDIRKELKAADSVKGVVIASVIPESPAAVAGLKAGDVIQEINDTQISDITMFYSSLNKPGSNKKIFQIDRQGSSVMIGLVK